MDSTKLLKNFRQNLKLGNFLIDVCKDTLQQRGSRWEINRGNFVIGLRGKKRTRQLSQLLLCPSLCTRLLQDPCNSQVLFGTKWDAHIARAYIVPSVLCYTMEYPPDAAWWNNLMEIDETLWNRVPLMIPFPPLWGADSDLPRWPWGSPALFEIACPRESPQNPSNFFRLDGWTGHLRLQFNLCPSSRLD